MIYVGTPSSAKVREAMSAGLIACMTTPKQGNRVPDGAAWCADNGVFGKGYPGDEAWWAWLSSRPWPAELCLFAVAPDVVGDAAATLERSRPWLARIRSLGYPAAFVAQNGLESLEVPWDEFDVLFLGGDTAWKIGEHARHLAAEAVARGKRVHMGRVNGWRRWQVAEAFGCDTADGTFLAFGPDRLLPEVLRWSAQPSLFVEGRQMSEPREAWWSSDRPWWQRPAPAPRAEAGPVAVDGQLALEVPPATSRRAS